MEFSINQVYTSPYAQDVEIGSRGFFADTLTELKRKVREGRELATLAAVNGEEAATRFCVSSVSSYFLFYLVDRPKEKKFRAYKNTAEMEPYTVADYVINKITGDRLMILGINECKVYITSKGWIDMDSLFDYYVWSDGTPCGMEVTDEED